MLESINRFDDCYQIIKQKKNSKIVSFITILIIIIYVFLMYFFFYPIKQTTTYYGTILEEEGETYVNVKIPYDDQSLYTKKHIHALIIDDKLVNYEIVDIINNIDYYEVILKLQLNLESSLIKLTFILNEKTLFEKMKEALKNGNDFKQ